jgi:uncharacterized delta-60 repeat protein
MTLFRWLSTAFSPARKRPTRVRLSVERLEDRLTPTAGLLDPTFGAGAGYVLSLFPNQQSNQANAVAVQSDGQIVIAGATAASGKSPGAQFLVARYNADGSLDTSFGTGGYTATGFNKAATAQADAVAIQPDGKILAAGWADISGTDYFALARYNANGTLDTTFGNNGKLLTNVVGFPDSIAVEADGNILVSGANTSSPATLVCYNANGTLDTTFGNGGELTNLPFYGQASMLIQPDGKIVLAGITDLAGGITSLMVARFNADGTADSSFGSGGEVITHVGSGNYNYSNGSLALQTNGDIIVGCLDPTSGTAIDLIRYNTNGSLDTTFGTGGIAYVPEPAGDSSIKNPNGIEVQSNGKIVATAPALDSSSHAQPAAVRVNADGSLDTSYGNGGWATIEIGAGDTLTASALQPDGKLLMAGYAGSYASLIRLTGDTTPTAASTLSVTGFPTVNNAGIAGSFTVTALDANGNTATGYTGTVHFTSSDPNAVLPADYTFTAADNGVHTFTATLNTTGTQSITAMDTATASITGTQSGITVTPASLPAYSLSVSGFPSTMMAGTAETITVTAEDVNGNTATGYRGTVQFSSSDQQAGLPAAYTFTAADQGVHTFTVTLKTAGTQSLTATDTATSGITGSESVTVTPAAASSFIISAPSSVTRGVAFSVTVTALDPYGNVATGYLGTIDFSSSDSSATLPPNYTFTASDGGVHTFTGQFILSKKGTKTITVTDTQNSTLTATDSINVT